ncbi:UPF0280 family protein [Candidatus Thorarchaeota archaeon]|nr:MAG: UPF0280 family protein [Candidatus Thorarchaeota archaeon]
MKRHHLQIGETIATVIVDDRYVPLAEVVVRETRKQIETYITQHPSFGTSHEPVEVERDAPTIIQRMATAGQQVGVGPMASVAGAIAEYVVEWLVAAGAPHVIFDNGGDIAMYLEHPIIAGIYTGSRGPNGFGLKITQTKTMLGLCTSSATVGHSLSYGKTDASIIYSEDVTLADAAATALGNWVSEKDTRLIELSLNKIMIDGIKGAMVTIEDTIGVCGHLPELVRANIDFDLISKGGRISG